jgi:hypothetical protein
MPRVLSIGSSSAEGHERVEASEAASTGPVGSSLEVDGTDALSPAGE